MEHQKLWIRLRRISKLGFQPLGSPARATLWERDGWVLWPCWAWPSSTSFSLPQSPHNPCQGLPLPISIPRQGKPVVGHLTRYNFGDGRRLSFRGDRDLFQTCSAHASSCRITSGQLCRHWRHILGTYRRIISHRCGHCFGIANTTSH
jgi:hypothetical protein